MTDIPANLLARPQALSCGQVIPNRIMKSATTEGLAGPDDNPNARHERLYRRWSEGGAGLLITGNVMIHRAHLERPGNVVLEDDRAMPALRAWARAGTSAGNQLWMQISHPGRQCPKAVNPQPVSASDVQLKLGGGFGQPRPLTETEILDIIERFGRAAGLAQEAGFTGVQLHGAHGYLISQFLSPVTNRRDDAWGGSLENRSRLLAESLKAMRAAVGPRFPISVKLNSSDFRKGGFDLDDCLKVIEWLNALGVDLLEISGGSYEQPRLMGIEGDSGTFHMPQHEGALKREAFFLRYAEAVRRVARMPLAMTGGFRERETMLAALESGDVDLIGMARPFCTDPDVPRKLLQGEIEQAPQREHEMRLGPGLLSLDSPIQMVRGLNMFSQMGWFYDRIEKMSDDRPLDAGPGPWKALVAAMRNDARAAKARHYQATGQPAAQE